MVESTCFQHTSSHPDKYNNSLDRIISKEEEREDPRRELQSSSNTVVFPHSTRFLRIQCILQCFHTQSSNFSTYRINSSPRNTTTTRLIPCRLLPATVPRVSKHSTWQNKAPGSLTAFQGHTAQAGFQ